MSDHDEPHPEAELGPVGEDGLEDGVEHDVGARARQRAHAFGLGGYGVSEAWSTMLRPVPVSVLMPGPRHHRIRPYGKHKINVITPPPSPDQY